MIEENIKDYRYERKFFIEALSRNEVFHIIRSHPAMFSEIYHERVINNIYFDSVSYINYVENVEGNGERVKYRIRWYGELFRHVEKPVLELKIKKSLLGKKRSYKLAPFTFDKNITWQDLQEVFKKSTVDKDLVVPLTLQNPSLINQYRRKYFMSADGNYRITVDDKQTFYQFNKFSNKFINKVKDNTSIILELKYAEHLFDKAHEISDHFPFRMTKSSKYVRGVDTLNQF